MREEHPGDKEELKNSKKERQQQPLERVVGVKR